MRVALLVTPDSPKRGPLSRATAFEIETCTPGVFVAFDPATEDAGIDGAALSRNLFEGVMQCRSPIQETSSLLDKVGDTPFALHD